MTKQEAITPEERQYLEALAGDLREVFADEVAKMLRVHDVQRALFMRVRAHLDDFLQHCEGGGLPSEFDAKSLWVDVNNACGDAVDHSQDQVLGPRDFDALKRAGEGRG